MPLVKPEWWEKHQAHAVILWSLLFAIPFALFYGAPKAVETVLECLIGDYLTFIVLLFGLFCVAGNIKLEGSLVGNPKVNVIMLAVGTFFSSCIGTTGASMLFVRPIIQIVLLEHEAVSGSRIKYDTASYHILSFGQEGLPEGYH